MSTSTTKTTITDEEYLMTQQQVMMLGALVRELPLDAFLRRIEECDTIAPMLDPTLYRAGMPKLDIIKRIARALYTVQSALPDLKEAEAADNHAAACLRLAGRLDAP